jgi:hypothetical protein
MEPEIIFIPSAFEHGVKEADIRHAFKTHISDVLMAGFDNKYFIAGFDCTGNLLEIMYNREDDDSVKVFHAMKCRKQFREKLGM